MKFTQGIKNCVKSGATDIVISPILLLAANHVKKDIPLEIDKARAIYPHLNITIGQPLGIHDKLIETIYKRIIEQKLEILPEAEVLLIGRGSSDVAVVQSMKEIANLLKKRFGFRAVNTCFLYGAGPSFEETIQYIKQYDTKQTFIVPYLLFSGLLRNGIQKKIQELELDSASIVLCDSVGYDKNVRDVLIERVHEVI